MVSFSSDGFGSLVDSFPPANWTNLVSSFLKSIAYSSYVLDHQIILCDCIDCQPQVEWTN